MACVASETGVLGVSCSARRSGRVAGGVRGVVGMPLWPPEPPPSGVTGAFSCSSASNLARSCEGAGGIGLGRSLRPTADEPPRADDAKSGFGAKSSPPADPENIFPHRAPCTQALQTQAPRSQRGPARRRRRAVAAAGRDGPDTDAGQASPDSGHSAARRRAVLAPVWLISGPTQSVARAAATPMAEVPRGEEEEEVPDAGVVQQLRDMAVAGQGMAVVREDEAKARSERWVRVWVCLRPSTDCVLRRQPRARGPGHAAPAHAAGRAGPRAAAADPEGGQDGARQVGAL